MITFIQSEIINYLKFLFPELTEKKIDEKFKNTEFSLNEERNRILIEIKDDNKIKGITMGWSDDNGIYGLVDEDREFDEKFQEGEL